MPTKLTMAEIIERLQQPIPQGMLKQKPLYSNKGGQRKQVGTAPFLPHQTCFDLMARTHGE